MPTIRYDAAKVRDIYFPCNETPSFYAPLASFIQSRSFYLVADVNHRAARITLLNIASNSRRQ